MPTYAYACKNCSHRFEQQQSFSDDALTVCPSCSQTALRKVYDTVGITFKGSGFYRTDSRGTSSSTSGASASGSTSGGGTAASSSSSGSGTSAPAA